MLPPSDGSISHSLTHSLTGMASPEPPSLVLMTQAPFCLSQSSCASEVYYSDGFDRWGAERWGVVTRCPLINYPGEKAMPGMPIGAQVISCMFLSAGVCVCVCLFIPLCPGSYTNMECYRLVYFVN